MLDDLMTDPTDMIDAAMDIIAPGYDAYEANEIAQNYVRACCGLG